MFVRGVGPMNNFILVEVSTSWLFSFFSVVVTQDQKGAHVLLV